MQPKGGDWIGTYYLYNQTSAIDTILKLLEAKKWIGAMYVTCISRYRYIYTFRTHIDSLCQDDSNDVLFKSVGQIPSSQWTIQISFYINVWALFYLGFLLKMQKKCLFDANSKTIHLSLTKFGQNIRRDDVKKPIVLLQHTSNIRGPRPIWNFSLL